MRIKVRSGNGRVHQIEDVQLLVVEDSKGNPVSVACYTGPAENFIVSTIADPDFNNILRQLGINKTVFRVDVPLIEGKSAERMPIIA